MTAPSGVATPEAADDTAAIDQAFGATIARLSLKNGHSGATMHRVARIASYVSAERGRGNSCVDLSLIGASMLDAPDVAVLRRALFDSGVCDDGRGVAPLVLDGTRLYLRRFHAAEVRLAAAIRSRLLDTTIPAPTPDPATRALFAALFHETRHDPDWQAVAAAAALRSPLLFITGGPGTGKTTVAARILALLLSQAPGRRVALAAPTGRAAARLAEAIAGAAADIRAHTGPSLALPEEGTTLHRLLGYSPVTDRFRAGPGTPLAEDVIVLDEASMIDLLMMDTFFAALRPGTRVIVLGDPDQLVSVETGFVLGDITRAADRDGEAHGLEFATNYASLSGRAIVSRADASPLRDAVVRLQHSWRFATQLGIGALARAVLARDADGAIAVLADAPGDDVRWQPAATGTAALLEPVLPEIERYLASVSPNDALSALGAFRVLAAHRDGSTGVTGLNAAIERWLAGRGVPMRGWYPHRPVLITANDPATRLFNGDVGVTLTIDGRTEVWFTDGRGGVRSVAPSRLPAHETAWAMTVHKAQGSEFGKVLLLLPEQDSRLLTRELLYTGITRARQAITVVGDAEIIRTAIGRSVARSSGLADRLG